MKRDEGTWPTLATRSTLRSQVTFCSIGNAAMLFYTLFDIGGRVCCLLKTVSRRCRRLCRIKGQSGYKQVQNSTPVPCHWD